MKRVQEGEKSRNILKDSKGGFSPGSKYGGKSEDLARFKLFVEDHARGIRILHDYQIEEGHADYDASNGRLAGDQVWIRDVVLTACDLLKNKKVTSLAIKCRNVQRRIAAGRLRVRVVLISMNRKVATAKERFRRFVKAEEIRYKVSQCGC